MDRRVMLTKESSKKRPASSGTAAMLICLVLIAGYQISRPQKIQIERKVKASGEGLVKRLPTVSMLLACRDQLGLNKEQLRSLEELKTQEKQELKPIEAQLSTITSRLKGTDNSSTSRVDLAQLHALAEALNEPSRHKREVVTRFSHKARQILAEKQQALSQEICSGSTAK